MSMTGRGPTRRGRLQASRALPGFLLSVLGLGLSLTGLVRTFALPAEARMQETWFAYSYDFRLDYSATVQQGAVYQEPIVSSGDLLKVRQPVDPPAYHRTLVSKLTDNLRISMPFRFTTDRPATLRTTYQVDGLLVVPGLWQRTYNAFPAREITTDAAEMTIDNFVVDIPMRQLITEMTAINENLKLNQEQFEIRLRPRVTVDVAGVREPVKIEIPCQDFLITVRGNYSIELDDVRNVSDSKSFSVTKILPMKMTIAGYDFDIATVRTAIIVALTIVAGLAAASLAMRWIRRATRQTDDLRQLGGSLITSTKLELPDEAVLVDVESVRQMVSLHLQTHRPVVRVGDFCYLLDGNTCYRLDLSGAIQAS